VENSNSGNSGLEAATVRNHYIRCAEVYNGQRSLVGYVRSNMTGRLRRFLRKASAIPARDNSNSIYGRNVKISPPYSGKNPRRRATGAERSQRFRRAAVACMEMQWMRPHQTFHAAGSGGGGSALPEVRERLFSIPLNLVTNDARCSVPLPPGNETP
jgi:hypothetical protein